MITVNSLKDKMAERAVGVVGKQKEFAILIPIVETSEGLKILLEVRGKSIKQPGDVCFPGGKMEEGEDVLTTALRETEEEIGISKDKIEILGRFDSLLEVNRVRMHTVVGLIKEEALEDIKLSEKEVQEYFLIPVDYLVNNKPDEHVMNIIQDDTGFPYEKHGINPEYKWRKASLTMYFWHWEGKCIWGLTAQILQWFISKME